MKRPNTTTTTTTNSTSRRYDYNDNCNTDNSNVAAMKRAMGRYRRKGGEDALSGFDEWIDPCRPQDFAHCLVKVSPTAALPMGHRNSNDKSKQLYYQGGPLYTLLDPPNSGFYIAPQALSPELQTHLNHAALTEYCQYKTNIDGVPPKPHETMNAPHETFWYLWKQQQLQQQQPKTKHANTTTIQYYKTFQKLSWATLGYHYDWTQRQYPAVAAADDDDDDNGAYAPVPDILQDLGALFARTALQLEQQQQQQRQDTTRDEANGDDTVQGSQGDSKNKNDNNDKNHLDFTASACIVNYYHSKSVMGAHRDDLEYDFTKPIVSLSLGKRPGLFVLSTMAMTKNHHHHDHHDYDNHDHVDTRNNIFPIILRPGDVVMMSGACRLAHHAMARVLPVDLPSSSSSSSVPVVVTASPAFTIVTTDYNVPPIPVEDRDALEAFCQTHRININLRQVYPDGKDPREQQQNNNSNNQRETTKNNTISV